MDPHFGVTPFCSCHVSLYVLFAASPFLDSRGITLTDSLPRWYAAFSWDDHIPGTGTANVAK